MQEATLSTCEHCEQSYPLETMTWVQGAERQHVFCSQRCADKWYVEQNPDEDPGEPWTGW